MEGGVILESTGNHGSGVCQRVPVMVHMVAFSVTGNDCPKKKKKKKKRKEATSILMWSGSTVSIPDHDIQIFTSC